MPVALPTREDYFEIGAQEVIARGLQRPVPLRISPAALRTEGTDINVIIAACSAMADEATRHLALRMAALYLDSAQGEDLDRLVADRFSPTVVRRQAAPAAVTVTFTRPIPPSPGAAVNLPVGQRLRTPDGVEFSLTSPASFAAASLGPVTASARATLAGTQGNVAAGAITQILASPDNAIAVQNAEPAAGGVDVESDESLRARARDFFRTARRGTLEAIEFGALTVTGVASATAVEELDAGGNPTGVVRLYIADANGQGNELLATAVRSALREYRAAGVIVDVLTTTPRLQEIAYQVTFLPGTNTLAAVDALKNLTVATINTLAAQETLPRSLLFALARSVPGVIVPSTAVLTPADDVVPAFAEIIRTTAALVTVNGV